MKIGLISDTHGRHHRTAAAVRTLEQLGASALIHCGDVGGERVLDALAGLPTWLVWGNTDFPDATLERYARALGLHPPADIPHRIVLDNRRIDLYHGHEPQFARLTRSLDDDPRFATTLRGIDYVVFGHTHRPLDRRIGTVRIINPGALHRVRTFTAALLDLATDQLTFWEIDESQPETAPPRRVHPA